MKNTLDFFQAHGIIRPSAKSLFELSIHFRAHPNARRGLPLPRAVFVAAFFWAILVFKRLFSCYDDARVFAVSKLCCLLFEITNPRTVARHGMIQGNQCGSGLPLRPIFTISSREQYMLSLRVGASRSCLVYRLPAGRRDFST